MAKQTIEITILVDYDEDEARAIAIEDGEDDGDTCSTEDMAARITNYITTTEDVIGPDCDRYWFGGVSNARGVWRVLP